MQCLCQCLELPELFEEGNINYFNLPQNSRLLLLEVGSIIELLPSFAVIDAKAYLIDYLIATDVSQSKEKDEAPKESIVGSQKSQRKYAKIKLDSEIGVVWGIDFKNV
ncbi:hypothetical protein RJT34_20111 [Clitoria ternatea]|uniref:Uncharacterized protein n=1 Tax=Clitoria ternatea TaxID=43366 RepID=A0AAN9IS97_CLITE